MGRQDILTFLEKDQAWARIQGPQSDIRQSLRRRTTLRQVQLQARLRFYRLLSAGLAAMLVIAAGLAFFTARRVVVIYPASGNEQQVYLHQGSTREIMQYHADNQLYITELNGNRLAYQDLQLQIVRSSEPLSTPADPDNTQSRLALQETEDSPYSNEENQPEGLYVPGLGSDLLASARLEF